ncbi:hypothetical protein [Bradyrhizobium sp. USDA 10063]
MRVSLPIFYSLGNFVGQNELVSRLPSDAFERFRVDPQLTPGMVFKQRTDSDRKSFPVDRRLWETVVPICSFSDGRLSRIDIHPVTFGLGDKRHLRGRPRLAAGEEAERILRRFADLSEPFATRFNIGTRVATLAI